MKNSDHFSWDLNLNLDSPQKFGTSLGPNFHFKPLGVFASQGPQPQQGILEIFDTSLQA